MIRFTASTRAPTALALALVGAAGLAQAAPFKAVLLLPADDPRLERSRVERAYLGHPTGAVTDGLAAAIKESRLELESAGASLALETVTVTDAAQAKAAALKAEKGGAVALFTDLPADATLAVADAVKLPVLNLSAAGDRLRQQDCRPRLYHVTPSERMRADALAQTLVSRKWMQVLLLTGPTPADAERAAVVQAALKRYGLKVTASKPFKLSGDPRERDLANPLLLTQGGHDVVWVVDTDGEFARTLPYRTATPRPVVGDAGLVAVAWHAQFERYGAPQVSRRFAREAKRPISAADWTAWLAGKALAAAVVAAPKGPAAAVHKSLAEGEVDGSQGVPMSFRPWDGQLRQPLLLTDGQGVIGSAPVEGILHPRNNLDTVGADAPEKLCKVTR
ncbi:MAG TPA: ABC transporter substrate-binding protein [Burkholderiaceae bacterium]|jgi:ABC transporter substrate binding protein (PQQ-dependent alcohol dehydrogenase system)|nr:ABC transporter substrate-binding protein [Burkholderiaceae bacterium]